MFLLSVKGILTNLACTDKGELEVDADIIPCEIGFYCVEINDEEIYVLIDSDSTCMCLTKPHVTQFLNYPWWHVVKLTIQLFDLSEI